jgi:hypothetical protein
MNPPDDLPPRRPLDVAQACAALGETLARHLPRPAPPPCDAGLAARLERALAASVRTAPPARRLGRWPLLAGVTLAGAAAVALAVSWGLGRGKLAYEIAGAVAAPGGRIDTAAGHPAQIRFSDGTNIALGERSAGRVRERTRAGATFTLERGHATFAVVHRPGASWLVEAGPFQIAVTGTRFHVRWAEEPGGLEVEMLEGSVTVRGGLAGRGVSLRAGQRLMAYAGRGSLTIGPANQPSALAAPAPLPAAPAVAPVPSGTPLPAPAAPRATATEHRAHRHAAAAGPGEAPPAGEAEVAVPFGAPNRDLLMNAGGELCRSFVPQFGFEKWTEGFTVATRELVALRSRSLDHTHSWCGNGSLKLAAEFNPSGPPNALGTLPYQTGQVTVGLGKTVDLRGKLVVVHVYVDAPAPVQLGMQVFAISHEQGTWVAGGVERNIGAGRWWTVRASFEEQERLAKGGPSALARVDGLAFQVYTMGQARTWNGTVYIDDVGWK